MCDVVPVPVEKERDRPQGGEEGVLLSSYCILSLLLFVLCVLFVLFVLFKLFVLCVV